MDPARIVEASEILKKVNPNNLHTDNNRSSYFACLAALHIDLGNNQATMNCIEMSSQLPHKDGVDDFVEKLRARINQSE